MGEVRNQKLGIHSAVNLLWEENSDRTGDVTGQFDIGLEVVFHLFRKSEHTGRTTGVFSFAIFARFDKHSLSEACDSSAFVRATHETMCLADLETNLQLKFVSRKTCA